MHSFRKSRQCGFVEGTKEAAHTVNILQHKTIARHRTHPNQCVPEWVNSQAKHGQQVTHLFPLKQAAKVKDWDAPDLERRGNFIQPPICPTEDRLIAQPHPCFLKLTDTRRNALSLIIQRFEATNLGTVWPVAAIRLQFEGQHALRRAQIWCHSAYSM